jgi:hypothetical protein
MPDWQGLFPRVAGTNTILKMANATTYYAGGELLTVAKDMSFSHHHTTTITSQGHQLGTAGLYAGAPDNYFTLTYETGEMTANGTNGTPNTGVETASAKVALNFGFYYA